MGNICHAGPVLRTDESLPPPPAPPSRTFSSSSIRKSHLFGRDPTLKHEDYVFTNIKGPSCLVKQPGSINGQQFLIENCHDCDIFLLDHCTGVQIDECTNCRLVIGPCDSSLFVRNCKDCTIICAVQQFRTRDCEALDVFLYSATEPILELSTKIRVACFPLTYFSLQQQFDKAGFSVWNNRWSEIYNYTPDHGTWKALPSTCHASPLKDIVEMHPDGAMGLWKLPSWTAEELGLTIDVPQLVVPLTSGLIARKDDAKGVLIVFPTPNTQLLLEFAQAMTVATADTEAPELIRTRQMKLTAAQAKALSPQDERVVQRAVDAAKDTAGSVIMDFQGPESENRCTSILHSGRFASEPVATSAVVFADSHYRRACELVFIEWKVTI